MQRDMMPRLKVTLSTHKNDLSSIQDVWHFVNENIIFQSGFMSLADVKPGKDISLNMNKLKMMKVRENAKIPQRATGGSAGLDLCACIEEPVMIPARGSTVVPTGIAIALPNAELAAFVFARSGLAIKHGIGLLNGVGVIDSDYRGEICVGLANQFDEPYLIMPGERIAQMIVMPVSLLAVEQTDSLDETGRGSGGFGSTGR